MQKGGSSSTCDADYFFCAPFCVVYLSLFSVYELLTVFTGGAFFLMFFLLMYVSTECVFHVLGL